MPLATFMSPEGRRVNWQVFEGKYLLINFWATWCGPCVIELPSFEKLRQRFKDTNLEVIAVSLDTQRDQEQIQRFLSNRSIGEFASYFDDAKEVKSAISMRGIPTTYLLDPNGNVLYVFEGDAVWHSQSAIEFFEAVVAQESL
jgi:thiol-disulfide isomerase/thioredoxin